MFCAFPLKKRRTAGAALVVVLDTKIAGFGWFADSSTLFA
jgi:hypothetical protein